MTRTLLLRLLLTILVVGVIVGGLVYWRQARGDAMANDKQTDGPTSGQTGMGGGNAGAATGEIGARTGRYKDLPAVSAPPAVFLPKWVAIMRTEQNRARAAELIAELRRNLRNAKPEAATAALLDFLKTGQDAATGLEFLVGANGFLDTAPTARVVALDELGRLNPAAAREFARTILETPSSPEEWSVALRNLAKGTDPESGRSDPFFQQKAGELLTQEKWRSNPTVGYLQGFDSAVYTGNAEFAPPLAEIVDGNYPAASKYAARLALDRMAQDNYAGVLSQLDLAANALGGSPTGRASIYARADVRRAEEKAVLENYLLNPKLSTEELNFFAKSFPNANLEISNNLLTTAATSSLDSLAKVDSASLAVVQGWLADPRFKARTQALEKIEQRLQTFVKSAEIGRSQNGGR